MNLFASIYDMNNFSGHSYSIVVDREKKMLFLYKILSINNNTYINMIVTLHLNLTAL